MISVDIINWHLRRSEAKGCKWYFWFKKKLLLKEIIILKTFFLMSLYKFKYKVQLKSINCGINYDSYIKEELRIDYRWVFVLKKISGIFDFDCIKLRIFYSWNLLFFFSHYSIGVVDSKEFCFILFEFQVNKSWRFKLISEYRFYK